MGLREAADLPVRGYSRGMKQRLTLGRTLLHQPRLVLLDEPYTGLDQHGSRLLTKILLSLREEGRTVLMITHSLAEGLELSNRVIIQHRGKLVFQATRDEVDRADFENLYFQAVER
jgi:heme exporter protein A